MSLTRKSILSGETVSKTGEGPARTRFIIVSWGINVFAFSIVYPFLPLYLHLERGIAMSLVGMIYPLMGLGSILGAPLAGFLADRFGRRALLIGGPVGRSVAFFLLAGMVAVEAPLPFFAATTLRVVILRLDISCLERRRYPPK